MKLTFLPALSLAIGIVDAQGGSTGGTGPYSSYYYQERDLPNHTIYQPKNPAGLKLPVIAWANGGCSTDGTSFSRFLTEVTSYGAIAIAVGKPGRGGKRRQMAVYPERQKAAIDWITKVAGKGNYSHVDASRIAVWGQSCGGVESYYNAFDERVSSIGIFNSGQLTPNESTTVAGKVTKPIFYFLGGPSDVAYPNGERDYTVLPKSTPSWIGNHALGHGADFNKANAGLIGVAGTRYMQWLLRGNTTAAAWFTNGDALKAGFVDQKSQNLGAIDVKPI
ncbi:hypothetical protein B0J11DRAFT_589718 [Dendryphion nanum]|uniref:Chlorophyllase n=1 Tax=Dendryphion nanum TaxID=256645 RepID=A0A9P9II13_9PLEO|nr:hypothetical protein B0J11DRAFT_589718 [Dendryphion nanum]